ncbi:MAG: hypothetical protein JNL05_00065 [Flavobacteriales bacterium]|nr:hypothetical protein [Flavobacteriales bacterium]
MFRCLVLTAFGLVSFVLAAQSEGMMSTDTLRSQGEAFVQPTEAGGLEPEVGREVALPDELQRGRANFRIRITRSGVDHEPWDLWEHAGDIAGGVFEWLLMR